MLVAIGSIRLRLVRMVGWIALKPVWLLRGILKYMAPTNDTFSLFAKMAFVRLMLSMDAMSCWPLYQLDIKNAFLYGDLAEEVYMELPPGFVA